MMGRPTRPYGWKRDATGVAQSWDAHCSGLLSRHQHRVGSLSTRNPSQLELRTQRRYQGRYQTCAAFTLASSIWTSARLNGMDISSPSEAFLYSIGRAREQAGVPPEFQAPLTDSGMYFSLAVRAVAELGFVPSYLWPYDDEHVNGRPHPNVFRMAADASGLSWSEIDGVDDRLERVREAFGSNAAVAFSMPVDRAFEQNDGEPIRSLSEKTLGEHGMRVLALDDDHGLVVIENWWDHWGLDGGTEILGSRNTGGVGLLSYDLFSSEAIGNVFALHVADRTQK